MRSKPLLRERFLFPAFAALITSIAGFGISFVPSGVAIAQEEGVQDEDASGDDLSDPVDLSAIEGDETWVLEFKPVKLRMITPRFGLPKGRTYWYLIYTLENKTGEDREAFVSVSAEADRGKQYADIYLPGVEEAIEAAEGRPLWGKADEFAQLAERDPAEEKYSYTTIKSGEKRYCVAVFNRLASTSKQFKIKVRGLSDELTVTPSEDGSYVMVTERVLRIHVERPGDEYEITNDSFQRMRTEWDKESIRVEYPSGA